MRVRFLVDYRGHLTDEQFYVAGDEVEFPDEVAEQLIADGRAEVVEQAQPNTDAGQVVTTDTGEAVQPAKSKRR